MNNCNTPRSCPRVMATLLRRGLSRRTLYGSKVPQTPGLEGLADEVDPSPTEATRAKSDEEETATSPSAASVALADASLPEASRASRRRQSVVGREELQAALEAEQRLVQAAGAGTELSDVLVSVVVCAGRLSII